MESLIIFGTPVAVLIHIFYTIYNDRIIKKELKQQYFVDQFLIVFKEDIEPRVRSIEKLIPHLNHMLSKVDCMLDHTKNWIDYVTNIAVKYNERFKTLECNKDDLFKIMTEHDVFIKYFNKTIAGLNKNKKGDK